MLKCTIWFTTEVIQLKLKCLCTLQCVKRHYCVSNIYRISPHFLWRKSQVVQSLHTFLNVCLPDHLDYVRYYLCQYMCTITWCSEYIHTQVIDTVPSWTSSVKHLLKIFSHIFLGNKITCEICSHAFTHMSSYRTHMRVHEEGRKYECSKCGKKFARKRNLKRHAEMKIKPCS